MTKKQSNAIKGVAVLLTAFYSLFYSVDIMKRLHLSWVIGSYEIQEKIAQMCAIGFSLFVFVTGYGLARKFKELKSTKEMAKSVWGKYVRMMSYMAVSFIMLEISCSLMDKNTEFSHAWSAEWGSQVLGALSNIFGIADFMNWNWLVTSWNYWGIYAILILIAPVFYKILQKYGAYVFLGLTVVSVYLINFTQYSGELKKYLPVMAVAMIASEYNLFERLQEFFDASRSHKVFLVAVDVLAIFMLLMLKYETTFPGTVLDWFWTLSLIVLIVFTVDQIKAFHVSLGWLGSISCYFLLVGKPISKIALKFSHHTILVFLIALALTAIVAIICRLVVVANPIEKINSINRTIAFEILLSAGITLVEYVIIAAVSSMVFMTNDDNSIQTFLSGAFTGEIFPVHQYTNVLLSYPLSWLYRIFPNVAWWYVHSQLAVALGLTGIHFAFLHLAGKRQEKIWKPLIVIILFDCTIVFFVIQNITFTIVPIILGCGAMTLLMLMFDLDSKKKQIICGIILAIVSTIMISHRRQSGYVIICYFLVVVIYKSLKKYGTFKKLMIHVAALLIPAVVIVGTATIINSKVQVATHGEEFMEFNDARVKFTDYPHVRKYEEDPELFDAAGWNKTALIQANSWCFINESITTESFQYVMEHNSRSFIDATSVRIRSILNQTKVKSVFVLWFISLILLGISIYTQKKRYLFWPFLCNLAGTIGLLVIQLVMGRILYRTLVVTLIPSITVNLIMYLDNPPVIVKPNTNRYKIITLILVAALLAPLVTQNFSVGRKKYYELTKEADKIVLDYVESHPENIYVPKGSVPYGYDPFLSNNTANLLPMGGAVYKSGGYQRKLELLGLDKLDGYTFAKDNVYFLTPVDADNLDLEKGSDVFFKVFYNWLKKDYDVTGCEKVDTVETPLKTYYVYKFLY